MWKPEENSNLIKINKCHNIRREEGAGRKQEPTHTGLTAWWLKQIEANWCGIQRGAIANICRRECTEIKKKRTKNINGGNIGHEGATVQEIGDTEDSKKAGVSTHVLI